jgi:GTP-binding protein
LKTNPLKASFLTSVAHMAQLPPEFGAEVAFAGRSNAGKSTAINTLTGCHGLAKTSKTPGRTQMLNYFSVSEDQKLVDLPGYGYATAPLAIKTAWQRLIPSYLAKRRVLTGLVWLMDSRHPLTERDIEFIEGLKRPPQALLILLTKADKLSFSQRQKTFKEVCLACVDIPYPHDILMFSATSKMGVDEARVWITQRLAQK